MTHTKDYALSVAGSGLRKLYDSLVIARVNCPRYPPKTRIAHIYARHTSISTHLLTKHTLVVPG